MAEIRFGNRMSDSDALMWRIEKDPQLRSTITAVCVFDREPDRDRVLERFERASRVIPRLRQRVVSAPLSPAPPRWVVDPDFDLRYHLRWVRAPGEGTLRDLLDLAEPLAMQGFDRARPLWEFTVVEGLAGGRSGLVQKVHHSVTDGVGGMELAASLLDLERDPEGGPPAAADAPEAPAPERPPARPSTTVNSHSGRARSKPCMARGWARSSRSRSVPPLGALTQRRW